MVPNVARQLENAVDRDRGVAGGPTLGEFYGSYFGLAGLRGLWLPGSADNTGAVYDRSGQGRTLTYNGNPTIGVHNNLVPYYDYDGTGDFHSRADEAGLDILGTETYIATALRGLTLGGWFYWSSAVKAGDNGLVSKYLSAGNQKSYVLYTNGGDSEARMIVSVDGITGTEVDSTIVLTTGKWYFIWGRFVPSTSLAVSVNNNANINTSTIPASIFNSTAAFNIAGFGGGSVNNCRCALAFLCASALSDELLTYLWYRGRVLFGV